MPDHAALEAIEAAAFADLYRAAPAVTRAAFAPEVTELGPITCLRCNGLQPAAIFRRACGLGVREPAGEAQLDAVVHHMARGARGFAIPVTPDAQPEALPAWLEARGFQRGYAFMKFSRSTAAVPQPSLAVEVQTVDDIDGDQAKEDFGLVVAESFGLPAVVGQWLSCLPGRPGWVCVLAKHDDKPAGAGAVYVQGEYAWLGLGGTLPEFRRRGTQGAVIVRRLQEAAARGARVAVTETGERVPDRPSSSYRNILRSGFVERYLRQNYMAPG